MRLRNRRSERGLTVIEVAIVTLVLAISAVLVLSYGPFARSSAPGKSGAQRIAEAEVERLRALGFETLLMTSAPATSADPRSPLSGVRHDPFSTVTRGSGSTYALPGGPPEPVALADHPKANPDYVDPRPGVWEDGQVVGKVYRFVTWASPDRTQKRVTIAVTVESGDSAAKPILSSTIVADPAAQERSGSSRTTAEDEGALPDGPVFKTLFAYDTPAGAGEYRAPEGDHQVHDTEAMPDLLGPDAPTNPFDPPQAPPYFNYSTDVAGGVAGGRVIQRASKGCKGKGPEQVQQWVSLPFEEPLELTGSASASLFTQTAGGATGAAKICVELYDVELDGSAIAGKPLLLGTGEYTLEDWPSEPEPVSFQFDYADGVLGLEAGHSIAVKVTVDAASSTDLALLYDHPYYASSFQFETPDDPALEE
jgi:hypothetical protein